MRNHHRSIPLLTGTFRHTAMFFPPVTAAAIAGWLRSRRDDADAARSERVR